MTLATPGNSGQNVQPLSITQHPAHLPNLNGIRCIAALLVLVHHIEQVKWMLNVPNVYSFYVIKNSGKLGVGMFFVLSGFLITYLLLRERDTAGTINIPNFYVRRILRIWPLYFLIVLSATFLAPTWPVLFDYRSAPPMSSAYFIPRVTLFLLVMPNLAIDFFYTNYLCSPAWSIGVEEQFYILWPHVMRTRNWVAKLKAIVLYALGIIAILAICSWVYQRFIPVAEAKSVWSIILVFLGQFRISLMMFGGLGATLLYYRHPILINWLFKPWVQIIGYAILLTMWLTGFQVPGFNLEVHGLFFGLLIFNVAGNPNTLVRLDNRFMEEIGKISYGIYLYHIPIIVVILNLLQRVTTTQTGVVYNLMVYGLSFFFTMLISYLSYRYLERPFLRIKDTRFAAGKGHTA